MGRPDIALKPYHPKMTAVIIEIKKVEKFTQMDAACDDALIQIETQGYVKGLLDEGYEKILQYGIAFCKKSCKVKMG